MNYETPESFDWIGKDLQGNVRRAWNVWLSLSDAQRDELQKAIECFQRQRLRDGSVIAGLLSNDNIINVITGPLETKCPYCGRG